jgi:hypothetical protein
MVGFEPLERHSMTGTVRPNLPGNGDPAKPVKSDHTR